MLHRRLLRADESDSVWNRLQAEWGVTPRDYWYPLCAPPPRPDVAAFDEDQFRAAIPAAALVGALQRLGVERVWELSESGPEYEVVPEYEMAVELFDPRCTGIESWWTAAAYNWLVYASHESSITVAGVLLDEVKRIWPQWEENLWKSGRRGWAQGDAAQ